MRRVSNRERDRGHLALLPRQKQAACHLSILPLCARENSTGPRNAESQRPPRGCLCKNPIRRFWSGCECRGVVALPAPAKQT